MPYKEALRTSLSLIREQGFIWVVFGIFTSTFTFWYCPNDHALEEIISEVSDSRHEVLHLVKKIEHLQGMRYLVENEDPFTMERLVREEFRLKKTSQPKPN